MNCSGVQNKAGEFTCFLVYIDATTIGDCVPESPSLVHADRYMDPKDPSILLPFGHGLSVRVPVWNAALRVARQYLTAAYILYIIGRQLVRMFFTTVYMYCRRTKVLTRGQKDTSFAHTVNLATLNPAQAC